MQRPAWIRGAAAVVGWTCVTGIATVGSFLGLSSVFTSGDSGASADTVVSADPETSTTGEPSTTTDPDDDADQTSSSSEPEPEEASGPDWEGWTQVDPNVYERTFGTEGGTAVVRMTPGTVDLLSASPADGYTATTQNDSPDHLAIVFWGGDVTVTIDTMWWNDQPYAQVTQV